MVPVELIAPPEYCVSVPLAGRLVIIYESASLSASEPVSVMSFITSSFADTVCAVAVGATLLEAKGRVDENKP